MGDILGSLFDPGNLSGQFGSGDVGADAARLQNDALREALEFQKQQFFTTQRNINPFIQAGQGALPSVVDSATVQGLDSNIRDISNSGIFGGLLEDRTRAVEGQLSAGGLTRSGTGVQAAAEIPTSLLLQLEGLLSGRTENIAGQGLNAAQGLGSIGQTGAANIATNIAQLGINSGNGILTDAQAKAAQQQQVIQAGATAASIFFSDPALKTNVEPIMEIGDLDLVEWDWIEETKGTIVELCGRTGFMADQVKQKYPEFVSEYGGFKIIDYPRLWDRLWEKYGSIPNTAAA